ncbi:AAA family ATPase [Bauldia sp.]|uniref:AAA family ATPase n=1 Tax=Bauldia sp. TaxID=2575872 RepID=UPI003BA99DB6
MYLKNALVLNSGPLSDLELEFKFSDNGTPLPTVFVGRNGSGKSNFLAYLTDALIELAARKFTDVAPKHDMGMHKWHRTIGSATIRTGSNHELALLKFEDGQTAYTYASKGGQIAKTDIQNRLEAFPQAPNWQPEGAHKTVEGPEERIEQIFRSGCYVSFPTDRTEEPYWSGSTSERDDARFADRFSYLLSKPISVRSSLSEIKPWLVDVLLDQMIDGIAVLQKIEGVDDAIAAAVANNTALANVNALLQTMFGVPDARVVRTGRKSGRRKLMIFKGNDVLLPSLDAFSSGQAMLFGIFGTIMMYADAGNAARPTTEMEGIVVIDEVDAHLHADLQHEVLPHLIHLFPKIQFVVSAHSPLFPLGMEKLFGETGFALLEMPSGVSITAERFSEFQSSFDYLKATRYFDETVMERASQLQRPQILCEGQTDPKYFRTAAELLGFEQLRDGADFDWIGVMANGQAKDGGEGQLRQARKTLLNNPSLLRSHTVLLFDCDQNDPPMDEGFLHVRVLVQNTENGRCGKGIENLLPDVVFEERFFDTTVVRDGPNETTKKVLNKSALCDFLCDEKCSPEDFEGFRPALETLADAIFPQEQNAAPVEP